MHECAELSIIELASAFFVKFAESGVDLFVGETFAYLFEFFFGNESVAIAIHRSESHFDFGLLASKFFKRQVPVMISIFFLEQLLNIIPEIGRDQAY